MQKNHEGGLSDHLPERAVLCVQLPAFYSTVIYRGGEGGRGDDLVGAVDDALFSGVARHLRDYCSNRCNVEIVPWYLFWRD